jgi:hypothetical protein
MGNLAVHGALDAAADAVLWSTPVDFYRLRDRIPGGIA